MEQEPNVAECKPVEKVQEVETNAVQQKLEEHIPDQSKVINIISYRICKQICLFV